MYAKRLSESDFRQMAHEWQRCLAHSSANPVFLSWAWQYSWWEVWSQILGLELVLIGVYDQSDQLVGLGPFYRRAILTRLGARVYRLYLIGSAWRLAPTVRTEYCGLVLPRGEELSVNHAILGYVSRLHWDELVCSDVVLENLGQFAPSGFKCSAPLKWITRGDDIGVRIDTSGSFDGWLEKLGKNTRLKAYNRRGYLRGRGDLCFGLHDSQSDGDFFDCLNQFHQKRWGKAVFDEDALRFHRLFLERLPLCGGHGELTSLRFNGECVSVLYDVVVANWRINLQSGYVEDFDTKVSLGSLHLGFATEAAFQAEGVGFYDLLAGSGKTHFYKSRFQGEVVKFLTFQVVRSRILNGLYRLQAVSPQAVSRLFNKRSGL